MRPPATTYGALVGRALIELNGAWQAPLVYAGPDSAVAAAQARHQLYRGLARALEFYTPRSPAAGASHGVGAAHRSAVSQVQAELAASAVATRAVLELPAGSPVERASVAGRMARAAAAAGTAWDLLATHLAADGLPRTPDGERIRGDVARGVLADGLLLARGVSGLDAALEPTMWRATLDPATDRSTRAVLRQVAEDCRRVTGVGLPAHARRVASELSGRLSAADWHGVDTMMTATTPPVRGIVTPDDAVAAVDGYRSWLVRRGRQLTMADLASLAATGSRLAGLVGVVTAAGTAAGESGRTGPAQAVEAWRRCHHALHRLRSAAASPGGHRQVFQLAGWLDQRHRDGLPSRPGEDGWAAWERVAAAVADRLPDLADAGARSLSGLLADGRVLAPADDARFLYLPAVAGDPDVLAAVDAFGAAQAASHRLAEPLSGVARPSIRPSAALVGQAFPSSVAAAMAATQRAAPAPPPAGPSRSLPAAAPRRAGHRPAG